MIVHGQMSGCVQRGLRSLEQRKKTLVWSRQWRLLGRDSHRWGAEGLSSGELARGQASGLGMRCGQGGVHLCTPRPPKNGSR